jgi:hypothetical protein
MTTEPNQPFHNDTPMADRVEALRNDRAQEGTQQSTGTEGTQQRPTKPDTYLSRAASSVGAELGGRFAHLAEQTIVGDRIAQLKGAPRKYLYPWQPPNSPFACDPVPDEPPLGFSINDVPDVSRT